MSDFKYRSFGGSHCGGNTHTVGPPAPDKRQEQHNRVEINDSTCPPHVEFWQAGQAIKRCGSGSIALAAYLHEQKQAPFATQILTRGGTIRLGCDQNGPFYMDRALPQRPLTHRSFWQRVCRTHVREGALCGEREDYALVTLCRAQDLLNLRPNLQYLRQFTRRALIASFNTRSLTLMRYFAPQYGIDEDNATGSASVQLAQYLYTQNGTRRLTIRQCSPGGGKIKTQHLGVRMIRISG